MKKIILFIIMFLFTFAIACQKTSHYIETSGDTTDGSNQISPDAPDENDDGNEDDSADNDATSELCTQTGGTMTEFSNGCADSCGSSDTCTQAFVTACDCGDDKCWDSNSGCVNNPLTETEAQNLLATSDCFFNITEGDATTCLVYEEPYWVIKKEGCLGECKIHETTQEISIDGTEACTGELTACETDEDCASIVPGCASFYACSDNVCVPVYNE